eukprot:m.869867 g.869867  ORF g.869867 m.869867 type:complete len:114 (+) comp59747_c1_seq1:101-442(+)
MFRVRLCVLLTLVASCRAKSLSPGSRALSPLSPSRSPKPDDDDLSGSEAEHSDLSSVGSPTRTNGRATSKRESEVNVGGSTGKQTAPPLEPLSARLDDMKLRITHDAIDVSEI